MLPILWLCVLFAAKGHLFLETLVVPSHPLRFLSLAGVSIQPTSQTFCKGSEDSPEQGKPPTLQGFFWTHTQGVLIHRFKAIKVPGRGFLLVSL